MNRYTTLLLTTILLTTFCAVSLYSYGSDVTAFVHVTVIPMEKERIMEDQTVIISNGKISAIGSSASIQVPDDAKRIDGSGKFLIPGLTDMHVHVNSPDNLLLWMAHGVTTVLNLNGRPTHLDWRSKLANNTMEGPMLYTAGPTIYTANTMRDGDSLTEAYHAAGYDCIKIYNDVTTEAYNAIIRTAKKYDMLTVGHIPRQPGFEGVLKAGQAIAHAEEYIYTILHDTIDDGKIPELAKATHDAGVTLIATLTAYDHITRQVDNLDAVLAQPELKYTPEWIKEEWSAENNRYSKKRGFKVQRLQQRLDFQKRMVMGMHKAGVRVLVGTDAMFNGMVTGSSALDEVINFVDIGFSAYDALKAATIDAADFLRMTKEFGTIEKGKRADLVLLDENPLTNIQNIRKQSGVMVRGRWYPKADIEKKLNSLPDKYSKIETAVKRNIRSNVAELIAFEKEYDPSTILLNRELMSIAKHDGAETLGNILRTIHRESANAPGMDEQSINEFGYNLLNKKLVQQAIAVFTFNSDLYPKSANTFDSLAEAYLTDGNKEMALKFYSKALEVDPGFENSRKMLEKIKSGN